MSDAEFQLDDDELNTRQRHLRMRWRMWGLILLGLLMLSFGVWRYAEHRRAMAMVAAIRAKGYPTTPEELAKWYPEVDEADNAASVILPAAKAIVVTNDDDVLAKLPWIGRADDPSVDQALSDEQMTLLKKVLADNASVLPALYRGAAMKRSHYPADLQRGMNMELAHLSPVRQAGKLLAVQAAAAESGDGERATKAIEAMVGLAHSLDAEPTLISQLVRLSIVSSSVQMCERVVQHATLSDADRRRLTAAFAGLDMQGPWRRAIIGERAGVGDVYNLPPSVLGPDVDKWEWYRTSGLLDIDRQVYLDRMQGYIDAAGLEPSKQIAAVQKVAARPRPWYSLLSRHVLVDGDEIYAVNLRALALLRIARVGLAVQRYQAATGHQPQRLADLVPKYLQSLPNDPFTGASLHDIKHTDDAGFTIYSVGDDGKDNGGVRRDAAGRQYRPGTDILFETH